MLDGLRAKSFLNLLLLSSSFSTFHHEHSNSNNGSSLIIRSLYYVHHSNLVLVSKLLTDENYVTWSRSMNSCIVNVIKNMLGFVDESIPKPAFCSRVVKNSLNKELSHCHNFDLEYLSKSRN